MCGLDGDIPFVTAFRIFSATFPVKTRNTKSSTTGSRHFTTCQKSCTSASSTRGIFRRAYLDELEVPSSARVLEVSVGTGANLRYSPPSVAFYGLDLSWGMLRRCLNNLQKWQRTAELFHGEAEHLPFRDNVFDVVFHVGGINFFNDEVGAMQEIPTIGWFTRD